MSIEYLEDFSEPLTPGMVKAQAIIHRYEMPSEIEQEIRRTPYRFGYGGFSEAVYYRTYSQLKSNGKKEDYPDTIIRVVKGIVSIVKDWKLKNCLEYDEDRWNDMALRFGKAFMKMQVLPPGRGLWISGTDYAYNRGSAAFNNCGFCSMDEGFIKASCWTMDSLMCGCGIGISTECKSDEFNNLVLPSSSNKKVYKVHDSREGWVKSLYLLLQSYFDGIHIEFDYSGLRIEGVPIRGFGGESSGPEPLRILHERVKIFIKCFIECRDFTNENSILDMIVSHINIYPKNNRIERPSLIYSLQQLIFSYEGSPTSDDDKSSYLISIISSYFKNLTKNEQNEYEILRDILNNITDMEDYKKVSYMLEEITSHYYDSLIFKLLLKDIMYKSEVFPKKTYSKTRLICDIFNSIGICIVAGNVRRSSEIVLANVKDPDFKDLKNFQLNPERGIIGWMSNNTVTLDKTEDFDELPNVAKRILDNGEPGILNRLNIKRYGRIGRQPIGREAEEDLGTGLNPCITGDTLILTSEGLNMVNHLIGRQFIAIVNGQEHSSTIDGFWSTGVKSVVKITLKNGMEIKVTPDHKILTERGMKPSTEFLEDEKIVLGNNTNYLNKKYLEYAKHLILGNLDKTNLDFDLLECSREYLDSYQLIFASLGIMSKIINGTDICFLELPKNADLYLNGKCNLVQEYSSEISKIEVLPDEEVYDCTIPGPHCFSGNGVIMSNCGEIILESYEYCNLAEIFPARCESFEDLQEAAFLATTYASTVSLLPTHWTCSNRVIAKNRRIGVSISGITDEIRRIGVTRFTKNCRAMYRTVRETNKRLAQENGVPESIRVTTVKPSGTISQLVGVPSGVHYNEFDYCIRRMRIGTTSKLSEILKKSGYDYEFDKMAGEGTLVFSFPLHQGDGRSADEVSPWEQASNLALMQREWADNSVSCTISVKPDTHGDELEHLLAHFAPVIKCLSVLPVTPIGVYEQMPYEKITKAQYEEMLSKVKPIDTNELDDIAIGTRGCDGDSCDLNAYKLSMKEFGK